MAKPLNVRIPILVTSGILALALSPAHADRRAPGSSDRAETFAIPRANSSAVDNEWRGPVTKTGSVSLPSTRQQIRFTYPGSAQSKRGQIPQNSPSTTSTPVKLVPVRAATAHQRIAPKSSAGYPGDALKTLAPAAVAGPALSPVSASVMLEETGLASWYGQAFDGKLTANGEIFDVNAMTAAHPTLPLPSLVQVINRENGREVVVRVNDRGPFVSDRIIDLSRRAADALDLTDQGTAEVSIRYLGPAPAINIEAPSLSLIANERQTVTSEPLQLVSAETQAPRRPSLYDQDILLGGAEPSLGVPDPGQSVPTPARTAPKVTYAAATPQTHSPAPTPASYTPQSASAGFNPGVYVQIGSFSDISNAQQMSATVDRNFNTDIEAARVKGADYFRVFIGPFPTKDAAERAKLQMKSNGIRDGFLVLR